jgi:hypothetical protein
MVIFIVGNSRSGTTMLGTILNQHHKIYRFEEIHFFEGMWSPKDYKQPISEESAKKLLKRLFFVERENGFFRDESTSKNDYSEDISNILANRKKDYSLEDIYGDFIFYETRKSNKEIPCKQTPRYLNYIPEILNIFPNPKVINMIRDPRDVLLSQKKKWKIRSLGINVIPFKEVIRSWINYHPVTISKLWASSINTSFKYKENMLLVKYEDLLAEPEKTLKIICQYLNIKYEPTMLDIPQIGSSLVKSDFSKKGIDKTRKDAWKNGGLTNTEIYICEKLTGKNMKKLGYEKSGIKPNYFMLLLLLLILPFKLFLAVLLNMNRMKNIIITIKRRL